MRLLYWYTRFLDENGNPRKYHGLDDFELNLSTDIKYHFDVNTYTFSQEPYSTPLPKYFWGNKPLYNINAIVGKNGDGKTTVIHIVIDTLQELYDRELKSSNETVFLVERNNKITLFHLTGSIRETETIHSSFETKKLLAGKNDLYEDCLELIDCTKIIYITNTLSEADDDRYHSNANHARSRDKFIYDCSLSSTIRHNLLNYRYQYSRQDLLNTYFSGEYYKQVRFVCDSTQYNYLSSLNKNHFKVPVPNQLFIRILEYKKDYQDLFDLPQGVKNQKNISKKIAYRLCGSCFYNFLSNLLRCDFTLPDHIDLPETAAYEDFKQIIESLELMQKQEKLTDDYYEIKRKNLSFIFVICESKEQLKQFHCSESEIKNLDEGFSVTLTVSVNEANKNYLLIKFISFYRQTCIPYYYLDFSWGLSSGENNLLRLLSSLFYVFDDSYSNLYNRIKGEIRAKCDSVILFMDEADLTYHPEWQRQLIQILAAFLPLEFGNCGIDDLQLILTTHSPLLLGDFPSNNVTYLGESNKKEKNTDRLNTFGQNIHTILKDSFFLENGTIGAFAADKINKTAEKLRDKDNLTPEDLKECKTIIDLVAPGILKSKLIELYEETEAGGKESMKQRMKKYAKRLQSDELETFIKVLEEEKRTKNDKN